MLVKMKVVAVGLMTIWTFLAAYGLPEEGIKAAMRFTILSN